MTSPVFTHPIVQLLEKCRSFNALKQVHSQMITTGLILHTFPLSRMLQLSCSISVEYALSIFSQASNRTIFLYNTLISCLSDSNQHTHLAFSVYTRILYELDIEPNSFTYPSLFKVCGSHLWLQVGQTLHAHVLKFLGFGYDRFVGASLVNHYSKCGKLGVSRYLFDRICQPDLATWNTILAAYARHSASDVSLVDGLCGVQNADLSMEVLNLFCEMQSSSVQPNEVTLVALANACADLGALSQGMWAHAYVLKNKLSLNCFLVTALVDMYAKCGCLAMANQLFAKFSEKDRLCYNTMIRGFAVNGYGRIALELFGRMKLDGLAPDNVTLVVTLSACSHAGLVDEGCKLFESMRRDYGIEPKLEHYGCLVDLLGRAGRLQEAMEEIDRMPMNANAALWRSLLGAARLYGNLEMGEVALQRLIELEPQTSGNYVLLSNIYARINKWDDVNRVRRLMKDRGVEKMPGSSLIEIGGAMHEFLMGDKTHPRAEKIYLKLEEMNTRLRASGYTPSTKDVLFDIEEEEKEDALSYHSERLAIAFGLIATESSTPIRIIKNLRVCSDCHVITKLVSMVYDREIIVRDGNRFHHFSNGTCSCLDYW